MTSEVWKPVPGYEDRFEVSDLGRVRSVERDVPSPRHGPGKTRRVRSHVLALHTWGAKYPGIVLTDEKGVSHREMVHRLVATVFIPNPFGHAFVNHLDNDTMNPRASNLEWCDQSRNIAHAYATGRRPVGEAHHFAFLSRDAHGRCVARGEVFE